MLRHLEAVVITLAIGIAGTAGAQTSVTLTQDGINHYATIEQDQTSTSSVTVTQTGDSNSVGSPMDLKTGTAAVVGVLQSGTQSSTVNVVQSGDNNSARVEQIGAQASAADVTQSGSYNTAGVEQYNGYNNATVTQAGSLNTASVYQDGTGAYSAQSINASIVQTGENQSATIKQAPIGTTVHAYLFSAAATQDGAYNEATITQTGKDATANIFQTGTGTSSFDMNRATISQSVYYVEGASTSASVTQSGTRHTANVTQRCLGSC